MNPKVILGEKIANILKPAAFLVLSGCLFFACSGDEKKTEERVIEESADVAPPVNGPIAESDPMKNKGVGPVTTVSIGSVDEALVKKGKEIFEGKCSACHKFDSKYVGPALGGVTTRRTPEWIMNMILNPVEMTQKDPIAQKLLEEHLTQMTFQDLKEDEARAVLEYFRSLDQKK